MLIPTTRCKSQPHFTVCKLRRFGCWSACHYIHAVDLLHRDQGEPFADILLILWVDVLLFANVDGNGQGGYRDSVDDFFLRCP